MSFRDNPISGGIGADEGFWTALEEGTFRMPRCASCTEWQWPALWRCPSCGGWEKRWEVVEPRGTVYSWTRCWQSFTKGRAEDVPYIVVLAELAHVGKARVLGVLEGSDEHLRIGATVQGTIDLPGDKTHGYPALRWSVIEEAAFTGQPTASTVPAGR